MPTHKPKIALVLTGGGARAAYQVGVLAAIAEWYPRVHTSPFTIYSGTSAGAINAVSLASYASSFRLGVKKLSWLWHRLDTSRIFASQPIGLLSHLASQTGQRFQSRYQPTSPFGLLNNRPLRELLNQTINFNKLNYQLLSGHLHGLSVTASNYQTGQSVSFFQGDTSILPWERARAVGRRSQLSTEHLLASSAIPFVFPASRIGHEFYGDGAIHQIAPLRPAIKMGAERILILDLTTGIRTAGNIDPSAPGLAMLGGHLMNAIFADTLSADLENLQRMNQIHLALNDAQRHQLGLRKVNVLHLRPSVPFEPVAKRFYRHMPFAARALLRFLGINASQDATFASYLLFEPAYLRQLIDIGYQDAQNHRSQILSLLIE
ncbi:MULTISPECIES: patatin-like phospholipase family protein [unclassified Salinivibrio]|uniref:patatin-like phospholipase family protein n=1 Tax=unclassified Salinivibrio TaxID=2636825 RepID=UPI000985BEC3|nr:MULTISPECIES: patatin-like phospholipase family protein [unclassified Salinivibrio]OOF10880.1 Patatin [Salinivibrio sp. PR5]OOF12814.1 Patatin [Salinivibrio sp. PR919]OOF19322.1 Patatin [Salinivibrio sp. PR932]